MQHSSTFYLWKSPEQVHVKKTKLIVVDCVKEIPMNSESLEMWEKFKKVESTPETEENISQFLKNGDYEHMVCVYNSFIYFLRKCPFRIGNNKS